jgi:hypothetical protein
MKAYMMTTTEIAQQMHLYESGQLDLDQILNLFSVLIQNGMVWTLQGSYGRMARHLIDSGSLTSDGIITHQYLPF